MSYNIVPSVVTGQAYPASSYNTYVKGNFEALWIYTTAGDIVYASSSTVLARLGIGANNSLLRSTGSAPSWMAPGSALQQLRVNAAGNALEWANSFTALTAYKISTNWNGSSKSVANTNVALTEFDASYTSSLGIKAVLLALSASWAAASGANTVNIRPNNTGTANGLLVRSLIAGQFIDNFGVVPVSAGNINIDVTGAAATVYIAMWGYLQ